MTWTRQDVIISHHKFGGVTDYLNKFFIYSQDPLKLHGVDQLCHKRDAHTIIDDSIWCTVKRRKPNPPDVTPLQVKNVGSEGHPVIHVGGLIPWNSLWGCCIITPGIGMSKGCWGVRRLGWFEAIEALDLSQDLIPSTFTKNTFGLDVPIPAKCWEITGIMTVGMSGPLILSDKEQPLVKRLRLSRVMPPPLGQGQKDLLSQLTVLKRNQTAVKADDAMINTSMWREHFLNGGGSLFCRQIQVVKSHLWGA